MAYVVPKTLPAIPRTWIQKPVGRIYHDGKYVAGTYRMVDSRGNITPIQYQEDRRDPKQYATGYVVDGVSKVFKDWKDVYAFWPEYLKMKAGEKDEIVGS